MLRYRLKCSIVGIERSSKGMQLIQIGSGEILLLPDGDREQGLMEIVFHGRNVSVFVQDVVERGVRIDVKAVVGATSFPLRKLEAC
ncbi:MAG TPA: hypothetical protein VFW44_22860 [Bryobacteraceae bacterium]|nr:hypothetical protein [Bryobacteraceae bacterium]